MERTPREKARDLAIRRLSGREYSRLEMAQYLRRKEIPEEIVEELVRELVEEGSIEDARYARMVARHQSMRGRGALYVLNQLKRKGVRMELGEVKRLLGEVGDVDELEAARRLVERRYAGFDTDRRIAARAYRALLARGFTADVALRAIRR